MSKTIFIFIATVFLMMALFSGGIVLSPTEQLMIAMGFILFLGIPHGAIDNVLFLQRFEMSNAAFIAIYVTISLMNVALWLLLPKIAYCGFLIVSAYHFGQSQFTHHFQTERKLHKGLYFSWGATLLSGLIFFNKPELSELSTTGVDLGAFASINESLVIDLVFYFGLASTLLILLFESIQRRIAWDTFFMEVLIMGMLLFTFKVFPFLIAFTMYFVILHAFKVLQEEYNFLKSGGLVKTVKGFIAMLTPLTLFSLAGIALLFVGINQEIVEMSYGFALLIVISSITMPHVVVMERFYLLQRSE